MKSIILITTLLICANIQIFGQFVLERPKIIYEIEYAVTGPRYWAECLNAWKIGPLLNGESYYMMFDSKGGYGSDVFDEVVYDSQHDAYWDKPDDQSTRHQLWKWTGPDGYYDFISVDVYINDYSTLEIGLWDHIWFGVAYQGYSHTLLISPMVSTSLLITGPKLDCYNPVQYSLENLNLAIGGSSAWTIKQNGITRASGTGVNASASNITNGALDVKYTVSFTSGLAPLTFEKEFGFGIFNNTVVEGDAAVCPNSLYVYTADVPGGHSSSYSYSWTYPSGWYYYSQWSNNIHLQTPILPENMTYGTVRVSITNACGTSGYSGITVYPGYNCGGYYMASPNPAITYTDIDIASENAKALETSYDSNITLTVVDKMGSPVMKVNVESLPYKLDTSRLQNGEYIIQIISQPKDQAPLIDSIKLVVSK